MREQSTEAQELEGGDAGPMVQIYSMKDIPEWKQPLVLELIAGSGTFVTGYDTPENLELLADDILEAIDEHGILEEYRQRKND